MHHFDPATECFNLLFEKLVSMLFSSLPTRFVALAISGIKLFVVILTLYSFCSE
jgi:hypothetical protein